MFSVDWSEESIQELAALWVHIESEARASVTSACADVDQRLARDPLGIGESRSGGQRILFVAPVAVVDQLEADEQTVTVLHVHFFRQRR